MAGYRMMVEGHKAEPFNNDGDEELMCPLCMEVLDETDRNFYPCTCDYQVCLWCLHYIRTTMGNKCPACRRDYDESTMKYKSNPRTQAASRTMTTKKKRELGDKEATTREERPSSPRSSANNINIKDVRVIQRNLVYVVGIPTRVAKKEVLKQTEYFGQYGKIQHIVINKSQNYNSHIGGPSYTAYITYSKKSEAASAIQGIDGSQVDGKLLRASYGTTKYCSYFFKGLKCTNPDCFYLHHFGDERERIAKDELASLMNKASNPPFGVVDHGRDNSVASKFKEDSARKHQEQYSQVKSSSIPLAKSRGSPVHDNPNGYNFTMNDHDSCSWDNLAAGVKEAGMQSDGMGYYVYQQPEELQLQYAVLGDGYSDGYAHAFDGSQQKRMDANFTSGDRIVPNYVQHVDMKSNTGGVTLDQYDVLQHLLRTPLLNDLQRYNRGEHIIYAIDVTSRELNGQGGSVTQSDESKTGHEDEAMMGGSAGGGSESSRWVVAEEVKSICALHVANKRRQIDYYKGINQLAPCKDGEIAMSPTMSSLEPTELFTDLESVEAIMYKIKRHSVLIENLAKQYTCDPQHRRTSADKSGRDSMEMSKSASPKSDSMTQESTFMDVSPLSSAELDMKNRQHVSSILYSSSLDESQLEAEMRLHEELMTAAQQLVEAQIEREKVFANHIMQLYDF